MSHVLVVSLVALVTQSRQKIQDIHSYFGPQDSYEIPCYHDFCNNTALCRCSCRSCRSNCSVRQDYHGYLSIVAIIAIVTILAVRAVKMLVGVIALVAVVTLLKCHCGDDLNKWLYANYIAWTAFNRETSCEFFVCSFVRIVAAVLVDGLVKTILRRLLCAYIVRIVFYWWPCAKCLVCNTLRDCIKQIILCNYIVVRLYPFAQPSSLEGMGGVTTL